MSLAVQTITLLIVVYLGMMFMVVESNNALTIYQEIMYYFSLFVISYSAEVFYVVCNDIHYNTRQLHIMNYILLPFLVIPATVVMFYIVGFSVTNILNSPRVIICVLMSIISYNSDRNYSFVLPMVITYLPLFTICKHICVVSTSVVFAKLSCRDTLSR